MANNPNQPTVLSILGDIAAIIGNEVSSALIQRRLARYDREHQEVIRRQSQGLDSHDVYESAKRAAEAAGVLSLSDFMQLFHEEYKERIAADDGMMMPNDDLYRDILLAAGTIYSEEGFGDPIPPPPQGLGAIEEARYRDRLIAKSAKVSDPAILSRVYVSIVRCLEHFTVFMPFLASKEAASILPENSLKISMLDLMDELGETLDSVILPFYTPAVIEAGLFHSIRQQLDANIERAFKKPDGGMPSESDLQGEALVKAFLGGTPLERLFYAKIPFYVPDSSMLEHCMICAGSGWGKTQLLERIILDFVSRDHPPSLVIVDSQGDMLKRIRQLAIFDPDTGKHKDRLLIIDPEIDSPALNMFDGSTPGRVYDQMTREQLESEVVELFTYVFSAIDGNLSRQMGTAFSYAVRLMLSLENATIHTLRRLLDDDAKTMDTSPFREDILKLDPTAQDFFRSHFFQQTLLGTRKALANRILGVLQIPAFDRMFSSVNKLDMYDALQTGKIVLVNTTKNMLKESGSALFGRFIIARVLSAAFERGALPEDKRRKAFLLIDEASEYLDDKTDSILKQARKYKLGLLIAFQYMEQMPPALRSSVFANTTVKYAGGVSHTDANALFKNMGLPNDSLIKSLRKGASSTQFACYVRNTTDRAVRLDIPFGALSNQPKLSDEALRKILARNRERLSYIPPPQPPALPETPPVVAPAEEPPVSLPPATPAIALPARKDQKPERKRSNPQLPSEGGSTF
jgi:hypothetical protein